MRPARPDIAVPPFPPDLEWIGGRVPAVERLAASGPVLVHFFDFAQLNSVRALPYLLTWRRRYGELGLATLGIHSHRFPFTRPVDAVSAARERLEIEHPVALDAAHVLWRDYGCKGWPSLFLWSKGGALRWYHLGEGSYRETEEAIQAELLAAELAERADLPQPLAPLRPTDAPGAVVIAPTPEAFPGGSAERSWPLADEGPLELDYEAGGAYAVLDGRGELAVALDGGAPQTLEVTHPGLYELAGHESNESHLLRLEASGELELYAVSFAPGIPA